MGDGEARLEDVGSGLAPVTDGWFVVNVADAAWITNEVFGARCIFEADPRVLRNRPDLEPQRFTDVGFTLCVIEPGRPSGLYHSESAQEGFLVLSGECVLLVDDEERPLRTWDFFHAPPGTAHCFVGAGDGPCVIFMTGRRSPDRSIAWPSSELARRNGAGVEGEPKTVTEAFAGLPHWQPGRPSRWSRLPWTR